MNFYNHPIINAIAENPWVEEDEIITLSGIVNTQEFQKEIKLLQTEGHLISDLGEYNLRANYLSTYFKGFCIDTIDVPYRSEVELARLLEWDNSVVVDDEDSFGFNLFIAEIAIIKKYKNAIEQLCGVVLDTEKYSYYIHAKWESPPYKYSNNYLKGITIIHVDDHPLFSAAMEKALKEKYFPESDWYHFTGTEQALEFVRKQIKSNKNPSLIITDLTPHGIQGYEFANNVRLLESEHEILNDPAAIIVMSMLEAEEPTIQLGLEDKTFAKYFHKSEEVAYMGAMLQEMLRPNILGYPSFM